MPILKLTLSLFILILSLLLHAQQHHPKVSLKVEQMAISAVLAEITRQTGVTFSYNPSAVSVDRKISVSCNNKTIDEALNLVLIRHGIGYTRVEGHLVLYPAPGVTVGAIPAGSKPVPRYTVSGYLRDGTTGEMLIGANVYVKGTSTGVMTNGYGFFSLTLPAGTYPMIFSYLGYKEEEREMVLSGDARIDIGLDPTGLEMKEVEIVAGDADGGINRNQMSDFRFSQHTLAQLPGFAGDLDIIRALQAVPGIQSFGDGSSLYFVRGGNSDQNLLLIDEVPVYNPSHLFGFFSAFSPEAINTVEVFKGDFPARFGGRLSSVIDIKAREGNMKRFGGSGNIGPYATSLTAEGPVIRDRMSFFISGRLSTINWLANLPAFKNRFDLNFFDINAKLNFRLNQNNRFFFTFYRGMDIFSRYLTVEVNSYGIRWDNLATTLRWNHLYSGKLFSNTTASYSRYNYALDLPQEQNGAWNSSISNLTLKSDFSWYLNPSNTIRSGLEITLHDSDPGNVFIESGGDSNVPHVADYHSIEYVVYASNEQQIGKRLTIRYGVRLPVWQDTGPTEVYYFDGNHQVIDTIQYGRGESYSVAFSPEPRLNAQYRTDERSFVKASYSRTTQFLQQLSNSTGPFTSLEVWAPAGPNIPPQTADQVALGYFREMVRNTFTLSVEGYYKWFSNRLDYRDHANLLFNPLIEGELRIGKGWSYGVECMIRKNTGRFTGWIGYTWSRAMAETPGINNDEPYRLAWDRPHDVSVNLSYDDHRHWRFSAGWIYLTGGAISVPTGFYYYNGYQVPVYGTKNNERLPAYHRLDLSAAYMFSKPENRYRHSLAITLYNAYGRFNPFSVNFNKMINDNGEFVVPSDMEGNYDLVPTTISVAGIIPSINYIFRF